MSWRISQTRAWLALPRDLLARRSSAWHTLWLVPIGKGTLERVFDALAVPVSQRATLDSAIDALRAVARRRGLDPSVVSFHRTDDSSIQLTLTKAQINWLRIRGRWLILTGAVTTADIWAPAEHAQWTRTASSRPRIGGGPSPVED
jgi:hypothetical protein